MSVDRLAHALRWRYAILAAVATIAAFRARLPAYTDDWPYFDLGSRLLLGSHPAWAHAPGGLHLYGNYPRFQIGPLALLLAAALLHSRVAVEVLIVLLGLGTIALVDATAAALHPHPDRVRARESAVLVGGTAMIIAWAMFKEWVHPDDALAVFLSAVSMRLLARGSPVLMAATLGLAVAAKPWAVVLAPLVLCFHGRERSRAALGLSGLMAATWLPFVLVDRHFFSAAKLEVHTAPGSVLHLFGVPVSSQPAWVRPTQLIVGLALCSLAALRGRWPAVPLVAIAARMVFDPGTFGYYTAALVAAALAWELLRTRRPVPLLTLGLVWFLLVVAPHLEADRVAGALRLAVLGTAILAPLTLPQERVSARTCTPQRRGI